MNTGYLPVQVSIKHLLQSESKSSVGVTMDDLLHPVVNVINGNAFGRIRRVLHSFISDVIT